MKKNSSTNNYSISIKKRTKSISGIAVFIVSFLIYLTTTSTHLISYGDSGEMITAAFTKGLPHPPGYPLYMLISGLLTHISSLSPAYTLNLLSAIFHSLALVFLYLASTHILEQIIIIKEQKNEKVYSQYANAASIGGALTLGFSFLFFLYAGIAEVFPLNDLFIAILLYLACIFRQLLLQDKIKTAYAILFLISICFGFALSNQQIIILFLPALLFFIFTNVYRKRQPHLLSNIIPLIISALLAITAFFIPYTYIPSLLHSHALLTWGNPQSFQAVLNEILRKDFIPTSGAIASSQNAYVTGVSFTSFFIEPLHYLGFLINHFYWAILIIAFGMWQLFIYTKRDTKSSFFYRYDIPLFLFLSFLFTGPLLASYTALNWNLGADASLYNDIGIHLRLYLQGEVLLAPFISIGLFALLLFITHELKRSITTIFIYLISLLLPVSLCAANLTGVTNYSFSFYELVATQTLQSLPRQAILICYTDMLCYSYAYVHYVKHIRPDIILVNDVPSRYKSVLLYHYPHLFSSAFHDDISIIRNILASHYTNTSIFIASPSLEQLQSIGAYGNPFFVIPYGYVLKIVTDPSVFNETLFTQSQRQQETIDSKIKKVQYDSRDFSKLGTLSSFTVAKSFIAYLLFKEGYKDYAQKVFAESTSLTSIHLALTDSLQTYFVSTSVSHPRLLDFMAYKQKGLAALAMHDYKKAQSYFESAYLLHSGDKEVIDDLLACYKHNNLLDQYRQLHTFREANN